MGNFTSPKKKNPKHDADHAGREIDGILTNRRIIPVFNSIVGLLTTAFSLVFYADYTSSLILTNQILGTLKWFSYLTLAVMLLGVAVFVFGIKQFIAAERSVATDSNVQSLFAIVADVLSSRRYLIALLVISAVYAFFYATISSVIVYRPAEDLLKGYVGVVPCVLVTVCCGYPGFVPVFTIYLTEHVGLLIVPVNMLLLLSVSSLVGVNGALALCLLQTRPKEGGASWIVRFAAITALFTSCPTCAGLFMGNVIGGVGATAVVTVLAVYQPLFVAVTYPLLLASIYFIARGLGQTSRGSCHTNHDVNASPEKSLHEQSHSPS